MTSKKHSERILGALREALGRPDIERPGVLIYQRDCLQAMQAMPQELVDLTVTSPPYNIGKEYENKLAVEKYVDWCASWIAQVHRISRESAAFWLNVGYLSLPNQAKCLPIPYLLWDKVPFFLIQEIVWNYGAGVASKRNFSPRNEKFLWYVKNQLDYVFNLDDVRDPNVKYPNQKKNGKLKCNPLGKNPTDVWQIAKVTSGANRSSVERTSHPAQFPVAVIERIVRACSQPGALVMDPFAGSGTTAAVARKTGRLSLGFEVESKYLEIIERRLDNLQEVAERNAAQGHLSFAGASFVKGAELVAGDFD
ncbi:DNA-methyltransferase [Dyella mobilis]|uniref:Methyltransferase n=1 Tax=Dyella mobilis TaxID=1849582 RepID=A0ABS2KFI0_9GAMM|nr:site-specific DNA-methyltransferase [Dyella mobilis]MBM7129640.1 site-specific DNA-methyltransferase [Dyella mobilis]GLQ98095.1 methyltransferase [Dyella mobilis]